MMGIYFSLNKSQAICALREQMNGQWQIIK